MINDNSVLHTKIEVLQNQIAEIDTEIHALHKPKWEMEEELRKLYFLRAIESQFTRDIKWAMDTPRVNGEIVLRGRPGTTGYFKLFTEYHDSLYSEDMHVTIRVDDNDATILFNTKELAIEYISKYELKVKIPDLSPVIEKAKSDLESLELMNVLLTDMQDKLNGD